MIIITKVTLLTDDNNIESINNRHGCATNSNSKACDISDSIKSDNISSSDENNIDINNNNRIGNTNSNDYGKIEII